LEIYLTELQVQRGLAPKTNLICFATRGRTAMLGLSAPSKLHLIACPFTGF